MSRRNCFVMRALQGFNGKSKNSGWERGDVGGYCRRSIYYSNHIFELKFFSFLFLLFFFFFLIVSIMKREKKQYRRELLLCKYINIIVFHIINIVKSWILYFVMVFAFSILKNDAFG